MLERELEILRECVRQQAQRSVEIEQGQALPTTAHITADCQLEPDDGFYGMENDGSGRPYRWTGPSRLFGVDVTFDRRAGRTLTIELATTLHPANIDGLRAFCGGEELRPIKHGTGSGPMRLTASIPTRPPGGPMRLWFAVPGLVSPGELDPTSTRSVWLSFR